MNHKRGKPRERRGHTVRCPIGFCHKTWKYSWSTRLEKLRPNERRKVQG